MQWKGKLIKKVDEKIITLSNKTCWKFHKSVLQQNKPLNTLTYTHNEFVVTPTDKSNETVAFICQLFCALILIKERGLDHNNTGTNKNFIPVHKTNNQVISGQPTFLTNKFSLVVNEGNKKLPNMYWSR